MKNSVVIEGTEVFFGEEIYDASSGLYVTLVDENRATSTGYTSYRYHNCWYLTYESYINSLEKQIQSAVEIEPSKVESSSSKKRLIHRVNKDFMNGKGENYPSYVKFNGNLWMLYTTIEEDENTIDETPKGLYSSDDVEGTLVIYAEVE